MFSGFDSLSRRDLLKSGAALAVLLGDGCEQLKRRPVRRNINNLGPNDPVIQTYAEAITKMKALPTTDQRNWTNQASIHLNHCSHGNWWLLPWHRWYLVYFERICQKLTGNQDFAIPYWNWTENPAVPDVFWNTGSPLYDSNRSITQGTPIPAEFVSHSVLEGILSEPNFQIFGSQASAGQQVFGGQGTLEATPHNNVHTHIGGDMGTYMSPLDPIFWTHHAMMDFCWVDWNDRGHADPNESQWTTLHFTDFFDENGNPVDVISGLSVLLPLVSYQYEPSQIGNTVAQQEIIRTRSELDRRKTLAQRGASSQIPIAQRFTLERRMEIPLRQAITAPITVQPEILRNALQQSGQGRVLLNLGKVTQPSTADFFVRVFVNAGGAVSAETPISDPHYAGSFGFFVDQHAAHNHGPSNFVVDVTGALRRLGPAGGNNVDISLVAVPYPGRAVQAAALPVESLELAVTR
jgi:tyrosinase